MQIFWIAIGGAIGSVLRYLANVATFELFDTKFPVATFFINAIGSLLIGFLWNIAPDLSEQSRAFVFVGLLGGFTTFSTFSLETMQLIQSGEIATAAINIFLHLIIGISLCFVGFSLGKAIFSA